jgi:uncharacterized protein
MMTQDTAIRSIRRLFDTVSSRTVSIGFIGGEPLLNRAVLHAAVEYAATEAQQRGASVTFGITTNGTMLRASDLQLFRSSPFAVTVSLDGGQSVNDALRRPRGRSSGFAEVVRRIRPLLADPGQARVAVRATVTRVNLQVTECVEALAAQGFQEVGISPLRTGPQRDLVLRGRDWDVLLHEMKLLGAREFARVKMGGQFRFSNLAAALKQIHRGASKALPCGSATNYLSVDAGGDYYSCHRTVGSAAFFLGSAETGPSLAARERFATARHVDHQTPCRECWARYLCGGGCHVEVLAGGREGCDYIRGWLEFVISLYPQVLAERPDLLEGVAD